MGEFDGVFYSIFSFLEVAYLIYSFHSQNMKSCSLRLYTAFECTTGGVGCVNNLARYLYFVNVSLGMNPKSFIQLGSQIKLLKEFLQ